MVIQRKFSNNPKVLPKYILSILNLYFPNYTLKNKNYIVNQIFPQIQITDDILELNIINDKTQQSYNLVVPYGFMLHPRFLERLVKVVDTLWNTFNIKLVITDTLRDTNEQLNINKSDSNVVKGKSPTISPHNVGLQVDFNPIIIQNGKDVVITSQMKVKTWTIVQETLNKYGLKWGGDFVSMYDPVHTQHPYSYSLIEQIKQDNIKSITKFVDMINKEPIVSFRETNLKNRV